MTVLRTLLKKKEKIEMTNGGKQEHRVADSSEGELWLTGAPLSFVFVRGWKGKGHIH